jgi:hypothetical protein
MMARHSRTGDRPDMARLPARHEQQRRRLTVRLTASGTIAAAAIILAAALAGCGHSTADGRAAAASSRAQVVPAAGELYQTLFKASARSVTVLDGAYLPCGTGKTKLYYSITLRLFPFTGRQDTNFDAYRNRVVSLVRGDGWTLRQRPSARLVTMPSVPFASYWLSKPQGKVTLAGSLGIVGDPKPSVGVGGTISVNGPCFEAHGAAGSLKSHPVTSPLPLPSTPPSPSHS